MALITTNLHVRASNDGKTIIVTDKDRGEEIHVPVWEMTKFIFVMNFMKEALTEETSTEGENNE